jgi:short-subunit dehydrogenase
VQSLRNATVVVAGASSGMGLDAALAFARRGAGLVLAARRREALDRAVRSCEAAGSPHAVALPTDVTDPAQTRALAQAAVDRFGGIDVWVNMAGLAAIGPFERIPIETQRRLIEVNLIGMMNGAHAALPDMLRRGRGVIINMASLAGRVPHPFAAAYSASKFGVAGFTDALRDELLARSAVQVCGVYPAARGQLHRSETTSSSAGARPGLRRRTHRRPGATSAPRAASRPASRDSAGL